MDVVELSETLYQRGTGMSTPNEPNDIDIDFEREGLENQVGQIIAQLVKYHRHTTAAELGYLCFTLTEQLHAEIHCLRPVADPELHEGIDEKAFVERVTLVMNERLEHALQVRALRLQSD